MTANVLCDRGRRDSAGVADLRRHECPLGVHGVGQTLQPGDGVGREHDLVSGVPQPSWDTAQYATRGEADAPGGHLPVELDQRIGHDVLRREPFERGRLDDAVPEGERTESGGSECVVHLVLFP